MNYTIEWAMVDRTVDNLTTRDFLRDVNRKTINFSFQEAIQEKLRQEAGSQGKFTFTISPTQGN